MWRIAAFALLLVCAGCASVRAPNSDIMLQESDAYFEKATLRQDPFDWAKP